jgi:hypothetical protein
VTVIVAPGTTAPLGSLMVPRKDVVAWPKARGPAERTQQATPQEKTPQARTRLRKTPDNFMTLLQKNYAFASGSNIWFGESAERLPL